MAKGMDLRRLLQKARSRSLFGMFTYESTADLFCSASLFSVYFRSVLVGGKGKAVAMALLLKGKAKGKGKGTDKTEDQTDPRVEKKWSS